MKAAVIYRLGTIPTYQEFPDPIIQQDHELFLQVKAASVKNLDKGRASGAHYASHTELPAIVGIDGVGILENGQRVYAQGLSGMIAEKAIIQQGKYTPIPDGLDYATAAALPNAVIGAAMALHSRANIKRGDTVLINGATGVTGQLAVQIAKYYGASKVIATGRNTEILNRLLAIGADETICLLQDEKAIIEELKALHKAQPIDIVIDYLWGRPVELIIAALKGGGLGDLSHPIKIITVGSMAGESLTLTSAVLRSAAIQLLGSGFGSLSSKDLQLFATSILPEMFQLAADGKLFLDTEIECLENIERAWQQELKNGKRLVISI